MLSRGQHVTEAGAKRVSLLEKCLGTEVRWDSTGDTDKPWSARVGPERWQVQVNDFPDEPMYTLVVDGKSVGEFDDWPASWRR